MARILIAGCGYVGLALAPLLASDGHHVFGLRRRPAGFPKGIEPVALDLSRPGSLAALPPDLHAMVYAAGAGDPTEPAYRAAYVDGPRNLLGHLRRRGDRVTRIVFVSSTAVYGEDDGAWVDEDSPTEPAHFSGRVLLEGERLVLASGFPSVILRLSGIYGPGRTWLVDRVRAAEASLSDTPRFTNRIHRDDCAGAIRHLLGLTSPQPIYLGTDHEPAEWNVVVRWLARRLGAPEPRIGTEAAAPGGRGSKRCRNDRLVGSGYRFLYPTWREGYAGILDSPAP